MCRQQMTANEDTEVNYNKVNSHEQPGQFFTSNAGMLHRKTANYIFRFYNICSWALLVAKINTGILTHST